MREQIINESIQSLRKEGLKFSVDSLASKLKISKKTIYKFFPSKEDLALALYEKYYSEVINAAQMIVEGYSSSDCCKLLQLYFDSKMMTRKDIFNKYKLNEKIYTYAHEHNNTLWEIISESLEGNQSERDSKTIRIIVDGVFEKLCNEQINPDDVIERLVRLL